MNKQLGLKIKKLRSDYALKTGKKMIQKDLAEKLGISRSYLGDIESGRTVATDEIISKLSEIFDIDSCELFKYKNTNTHNDIVDFDNSNFINESSCTYNVIDKYEIANIPIVGFIRAGEPILAQDHIEGYHPALKSNLCKDKNYFYLRVQGDSMNQEFNEGSLLLIEKTPCIENGSIAVVLIDGTEATVKKVIQNENMITLIPMSTNSIYVPKMYDIQKNKIEIIGKVKEATKIY
ncbi:helix-turn-helix domain-containing protein [Clostridium botulinum]|uniref:XRE family transcriptional regulator n=1 Tax=unclassified Clostridium TaxID=2614128 RepID=UPI0013CC3BB6|nr:MULTISPECIES: XRE family transcriptional regulator [unclassified Clostridium]MBY7007909.1 helix-turn-helix domain-containing protein [Clostridium botulinum]NFG31431.1 helix-turn-helix domain-containing protein [Clostridium botulinum]NFH72696.1 helix-turn-helix domain-containing protein [Clostridium botulinum]NFI00891.1 helix-turn-helix domain-containing protein [Clostridium botulinum]NFI62967.1 helix-turn-helix domain-containing protein [Clostridium botulinum]